jgi:hypothetical protein
MTIEEGIVTFLKSDAPLTAVIGSRVYPMRLPQGETLPAVTYQRISSPPRSSHDGASTLKNPRFQFKSWGETYADARTVADLLKAALDGYVGLMGTVAVQNTIIMNDLDYNDPQTETYQGVVDAIIWHRE